MQPWLSNFQQERLFANKVLKIFNLTDCLKETHSSKLFSLACYVRTYVSKQRWQYLNRTAIFLPNNYVCIHVVRKLVLIKLLKCCIKVFLTFIKITQLCMFSHCLPIPLFRYFLNPAVSASSVRQYSLEYSWASSPWPPGLWGSPNCKCVYVKL